MEDSKEKDKEELKKLLDELYDHLLKNSKPLEPDFAKILHDNFWDLLVD